MIKIAPYYQRLLETAKNAIKSGEPISFIGMYDGGQDYLFNILAPELNQEKQEKQLSIVVDLSGTNGKPQEEIKSMILGFSLKVGQLPAECNSFEKLYANLSQLARLKKIVLVVNVGSEAEISQDFLLFLSRLRNLLAWNFSYLIFAYTSLLEKEIMKDPAIEKLIKRHILPILPLDFENSKVVLNNYQERYQKELSQKIREKIIKLSGGNPGLIKALYLQASKTEGWQQSDFDEEGLKIRLQRIITGLSDKLLEVLKNVDQKKKISDTQSLVFLKKFGYLNQKGEIFSPLITQAVKRFLPIKATGLNEEIALLLTRSERDVLKYFQEKENQIVSRDELAKVLWGEKWADKYSDWAIDQFIHELRGKIKKIKIGKIKTKKGEGFIYISSQ